LLKKIFFFYFSKNYFGLCSPTRSATKNFGCEEPGKFLGFILLQRKASGKFLGLILFWREAACKNFEEKRRNYIQSFK
jgi:hypothetical protein